MASPIIIGGAAAIGLALAAKREAGEDGAPITTGAPGVVGTRKTTVGQLLDAHAGNNSILAVGTGTKMHPSVPELNALESQMLAYYSRDWISNAKATGSVAVAGVQATTWSGMVAEYLAKGWIKPAIGNVGGPSPVQHTTSQLPSPLISAGGGNWTQGAQTVADQKIRELEAKIASEYAALTDKAKAAGAEALNKALKPSPGLTGKENFNEAAKKIGSVVGAAGGAAACGIVPGAGVALAPVCGYLGAIGGAYIGERLGPAVTKAYNGIKSAVDSAWDGAKGSVKSVISKIGGLF